ncbi:MAG TPA: SWIM zinc finger family protein [Chloroflexota bacterium]|nr:SWIM zinc finger family protein [Chloroflexota bacterium]
MAITASEQRAISKAMALDLAAQVERVRFGLYRVPSTSEAGVTWTVAIENGTYSCTCKAANKSACVHRAAVYLAKMVASGAKVVGVKPAARQRLAQAA